MIVSKVLLTGVQEINRDVCDWLHCSAHCKESRRFPEFVQRALSSLFSQYPIIIVLTL